MSKLRDDSIALYRKPCPVDWKPHDWRYASHAPGYEIGDICACCQKCRMRAISPNSPEDAMTTPTPCDHEEHDKATAIYADGLCPLCLQRDLAAAQEAIRYLVDHQGHFQTKHAPAIDAAMRKP